MALEAQQVEFPQLPKCEMYIATMGEEAQKRPSCCWMSCTAAAFPPTRICAAAA